MTTTHWLCFLAFLPFFITVILMAVFKVQRSKKLKELANRLEQNPGNVVVAQGVIHKLRDLA